MNQAISCYFFCISFIIDSDFSFNILFIFSSSSLNFTISTISPFLSNSLLSFDRHCHIKRRVNYDKAPGKSQDHIFQGVKDHYFTGSRSYFRFSATNDKRKKRLNSLNIVSFSAREPAMLLKLAPLGMPFVYQRRCLRKLRLPRPSP